jgi:hypothetical protein
MSLKWPLKLMEVGDFAVISGLPVGRVKQYLCTYAYISGRKFVSKRRTVDGRDAVLVRRLHDDGEAPQVQAPQVFYMDADEAQQNDPAKAARRAIERREALTDRRGAALIGNALEG